jgi:hypothetical protein
MPIVDKVIAEPQLQGYTVTINGNTYFTRDFCIEGENVTLEIVDENEVKLTTSETVDDLLFL